MKTAELLARIKQLENEPCPDKEDWFDLLYGNIPTIKEALSNIKQIQSDAQKHGEQRGWKKGMSQAAGIIASKDFGGMAALKQQCVTDILSAIDNKTNL